MRSPELVVFGSLTIDNVVRANGEVLPESAGGNAVYAALGAHVWSDSVGIVSRWGAGHPEAFIDRLARCGIDVGGDFVKAALYGVVAASFCVEQSGVEGLIGVDRREAEYRLAALSRRTGIAIPVETSGRAADMLERHPPKLRPGQPPCREK